MSLTDRYGLPVTAASRAAVDAYDRGVRALLGFGADTLEAFREALAHDPDFALARAALAVSLYLDEKIPEGRAAMDAAAAAAARAARARAPAHRGARPLGRRARQRGGRRHQGDPGRASARRGPAPAPVLHPLLAGALGRHAGLDRIRGRRLRRGLLRARAARVQPRGEPALRRGAGPGGAGDGAQSEGRLGGARHGPRALRARATMPAASRPCPRASIPAIISDTSGTTCSGTSPSCTWPRGATSGWSGSSRACSATSRSPPDPTFRIRCRSRGGSTSSAARTRGAGSTWVRRPRAWLDLPLLLFHDAHVAMALAAAGDWPSAELQLDRLRQRGKKTRNATLPEVLVPLIEGLHAFARGDYRAAVERIAADRCPHRRGGRQPRPARGVPRHAPRRRPSRRALRPRAAAARSAARQAPQSRPLLDDGAAGPLIGEPTRMIDRNDPAVAGA